MANQIATSIANAQLFEETQSALMDTETLLNVSQLASNTLDVEKSLSEILDLVLKATDIEAGLISKETMYIDLATLWVELGVQP